MRWYRISHLKFTYIIKNKVWHLCKLLLFCIHVYIIHFTPLSVPILKFIQRNLDNSSNIRWKYITCIVNSTQTDNIQLCSLYLVLKTKLRIYSCHRVTSCLYMYSCVAFTPSQFVGYLRIILNTPLWILVKHLVESHSFWSGWNAELLGSSSGSKLIAYTRRW